MNTDKLMDRGLHIAARPIAFTKMVVGVTANPFRKQRRSASEYYNRSLMQNEDFGLDEEVHNCPDCKGYWGIRNKMYHAGDPTPLSMWGYNPKSSDKVYSHDSHCSKHWKRVKRYQKLRYLATGEF